MIIFHEVYKITYLDEFLDLFIKNKSICINNINYSLDLVNGEMDYDFCGFIKI
jgi:hypothetical protein